VGGVRGGSTDPEILEVWILPQVPEVTHAGQRLLRAIRLGLLDSWETEPDCRMQ